MTDEILTPPANKEFEDGFDNSGSSVARRIAKFFFLIGLGWAALAGAFVADVQLRYADRIEDTVESAEPAKVAIVLGAAVTAKGQPSDALRDRLLVGLALYQQKKAEKILITGDDGRYHVDEIKSMREFLRARGVPASDILEDGHGYRTYESCKRAVEVFDIRDAIVVTQRFHLGRALYLCNRLGMEARGVASDLTTYRRIAYFTARDLAASLEAWIDVNIRPPKPPVAY